MQNKQAVMFMYNENSELKVKFALLEESQIPTMQTNLQALKPIILTKLTINNVIDSVASNLGNEYSNQQKLLYAYPCRGTYAPEVERTITTKEQELNLKRDTLREQLKTLFEIKEYLNNN